MEGIFLLFFLYLFGAIPVVRRMLKYYLQYCNINATDEDRFYAVETGMQYLVIKTLLYLLNYFITLY